MSRIIRLAFLAPEIVEQIVHGCQPPELTADSLLKDRTQLPLALGVPAQDVKISLPGLIFTNGRVPTESLSRPSVRVLSSALLMRSSASRPFSPRDAKVHRRNSKWRKPPDSGMKSRDWSFSGGL